MNRLFLPLIAFAVLLFLFLERSLAAEQVRIPASEPHIKHQFVLTGELVFPSGNGLFPAVVLMHGCGGLQKSVLQSLRDHARALNAAGFATLILDSFGSRGLGGGKLCKSGYSLLNASAYRVSDAFDALKFLRSHPRIDGGHVFQMGQSNGGSVSLRLAQRGSMIFSGASILGSDAKPFRAVAAFYPGCHHVSANGLDLIADAMLFLGGRDDWTPPERYLAGKSNTPFTYQPVLYGNATHSFDLPIQPTTYLGHRVGLNPTVRSDSRKRMIAFFKERISQ